jgi:hypothetical protein
LPIKYTEHRSSCCSLCVAGGSAPGPAVNGVGNEQAPAPSPGHSGSIGFSISVGSLIIGFVVASFSSFWMIFALFCDDYESMSHEGANLLTWAETHLFWKLLRLVLWWGYLFEIWFLVYLCLMPCDFSASDVCGMVWALDTPISFSEFALAVYPFFQSAFQILKTCKFSIEKHLYEAHKWSLGKDCYNGEFLVSSYLILQESLKDHNTWNKA